MWDFMPTCAEIAGIEQPAGRDGISYLPALLGDLAHQKSHEYLYWAFYERGGKQAVRMGNWKAVRNDVAKEPDGPLELYDLATDIGEKTNVADQHPDVVKKLDELMKQAYTESPLWKFR